MAEVSNIDEPMDISSSTAITADLTDNKTIDQIIPFSDLCALFDKIEQKPGKENKKQIFNVFLRNWRRLHEQLYKDYESGKGDNFYPILRLCLPHLDQKRTAYGMKETILAKIYIEVLRYNSTSIVLSFLFFFITRLCKDYTHVWKPYK